MILEMKTFFLFLNIEKQKAIVFYVPNFYTFILFYEYQYLT